MHYDLKEIKVLDSYKLFVRFEDEKQGVVDLSGIIDKGGVFKKLQKRGIDGTKYPNRSKRRFSIMFFAAHVWGR
jgi:hypothetical protein